MDPQQWLARYDERLAEVATRAKEADALLRQVGGTATSRRGEVEVRVSASGTLEDLTLTPAARTLESDELARLILDTTRRARHAVSTQIAGISAKYFADTPVLDVLGQHLPAGVRVGGTCDEDDFFDNPEITR
jgi:DNA-binding protein YbaB